MRLMLKPSKEGLVPDETIEEKKKQFQRNLWQNFEQDNGQTLVVKNL